MSNTPPIIIEFYMLITLVQGWVLFPLMVVSGIVILTRGFTMWRKTGGDWQAVFKSLESILTFFVIVVIAFSIFNSYDWLRSTGLGKNLPDLKADLEKANKQEQQR